MSSNSNNNNSNNNSNNNKTNNNACQNPTDNSKKNLKDTQFLSKLCSSNITTNKFALKKINDKSAVNTQANKFSSYVDRNKYLKIFEGKVKDLAMTFATPTSATIVFFPVGYPKTVTIVIQNQQDIYDTHSISILSSPYTFQNLIPNSHYDVTATATYSSNSIYTETFINAIETLNEGPATNVTISKISNKTAYISFIYPIGTTDSVNITITNKNDQTDIQQINNITTDYYNITGLQINSTYTFLISSVYIITKNIYSVTFPFTTLFEEFPTNIQFTNITNVSATITYTFIGYPLYNSIIVVNNQNPVESYTQNTLNTSTTWNLKSNVTYNVSITSVYSSGNKYPVNISNAFYILNEGYPLQVQLINIKGTSILFSFENAIGNPSYYQLNLINTQNATDQQQIHIDINNTHNIFVGGISSNSIYSFQLQSIYLSTGNIYTYTTSLQTLNEGPISNFTLIHIGNKYITFSFTNPPGESYVINLIANSSVDFKSLNITSNNYTLQNLFTNTEYKLIINTIYTLSNTTYTYNYPQTIITLNEGPSIINNIYDITDKYAYINFFNPYAIADQYLIKSIDTQGNTIITTTNGIIGGNIFINGLTPNTSYTSTLQTIYHLNTPNETIYTTVPSIQINTKNAPTNIIVGEFITDTSASITFVAPNIQPNNYLIFLNNTNTLLYDISFSQIILLPNGLSYLIINGLSPNTNYNLFFAAYYNDTSSYFMNNQSFLITTKGPVRNINITTTSTSATIRYNPPLLQYNWNYNIYLYSNNNILQNSINITDISYTFNLNANTTYKVKVDAIYQENQIFKSNINTFITRGFPDNIQIVNVTNNSFTLYWNTLLFPPENYQLVYEYNPTIDITFSNTNVIPVSNTISSYIVSGLEKDISYYNIRLSSIYTDINTSYVTSNTPLLVATNSNPSFMVINQTNTTIDISFITPKNTIPDTYIITAINTSTLVSRDISFNYSSDIYKIRDVSDNVNYNLIMSSYYNVNNYKVSSLPINTNTHGTPVITGFTNVYDTYSTINIERLLISPSNNYTLYVTSINIPEISYNIIFINNNNSSSSYNTPIIPQTPYFIPNTQYKIKISSNYSDTEIYTSAENILNTRGSSNISSVITSDVSGIVIINPSISWLNTNMTVGYTIQNSIQNQNVTSTTILYDTRNIPYFLISDLSQNNYNTIAINVTYVDTNATYQSIPYSFYTEGPPTNLIIDPGSIFNTYLTVKFTTPYNCNNYTLYAIPTQNPQNSLSQSFFISNNVNVQSNVSYTLPSSFLSEDTSYNIYVASNYNNYNGNSNIVSISTYATLIINDFNNNITDVSAGVILKKPLINPTRIAYSYYNTNIFTDVSFIIDTSYINFVINGLSPNTLYSNFRIQSYYSTNNATYTSTKNTFSFSTKGINLTNQNILTTDTSANISFPIPNVSPSVYYYNIGGDDRVFIPIIQNNKIQLFINDLTINTQYSLIIKTTYSNISGIYVSSPISFYTKMIPTITNIVPTDTSIQVYFKYIYTTVTKYSYIIGEYKQAIKEITFSTPTKPTNPTDPIIVSLLISDLSQNTFYSTFKIAAYYSDIVQTYYSSNISFNTMGNPNSVILSTPPFYNNNNNKNQVTLSFYPPLYDPTYYIITNPYSLLDTSHVYITDMSYDKMNNIYSYTLNNISRNYSTNPYDVSYIGVSVSSYYDVTNKIMPINTFKPIKSLVPLENCTSIATSYTGKYVTFTTSNAMYISSNNGSTWTTNSISMDDSYKKVVMDSTGLYQYVLTNNGIYNNNNNVPVYNFNSDSINIGQDICIDNSGETIFAIYATNNNNSCVYSSNYGNTNTWIINTNITNATNCIMNDYYVYYTSNNGSIYRLSKNDLSVIGTIVYSIDIITNVSNYIMCTNDANTNIVIGYQNQTNNNYTLIRSVNGNYNNWNIVADSSLNWTNISSDAKGIYLIGTNNGVGAYLSNNGGIQWNVLLPTYPSLQNTIISGNGMYVYSYDSNNVYYYNVPLEKGSVNNINISNIGLEGGSVSFDPPTFTPDLSYEIIVNNHNNSLLETPHIYYTIDTSNIALFDLCSNTLYDVSINSNYSNKLQTFTNALATPFYTISPPLDLSLNGNPSDISASIQFIKPFNTPSNYSLSIVENNKTKSISINNNEITSINQTGYYTISNISSDTFYNITLSSQYNGSGSASNSISFYTRGSPSNPIITNIYDTSANISFSPPKNTNDLDYYIVTCIAESSQITTNTTNTSTIINGLSPNTIYDISISTVYTNPTQIVSKNYSNKIYTKGGPILSLYDNNTTDTSAIIQFISPVSIQNNIILLDHYELYINNNFVNNIPTQNIYSISDISYIILTNLIPNTSYNNAIYIKTYYTDVIGNFNSNYVNFITEGYPQNIYSDYNLIQDISATIKFTPPLNQSTKFINYTIFYNTTSSNIFKETVEPTNILKNLSPNTEYSVAIQSNYSNLTTKSPYITFKTAGKSSINNITTITDSSANVSFNPPILLPSKYILLIYRQVDNINIIQYDIPYTYTSYAITNLPQNNKLYANILTVYPNITLTSDITSAFTTYGPPNNIYFVAKSITDTSANVQFSEPIIPPSSYTILLKNITNSSIQEISFQNVRYDVLPFSMTNLNPSTAYEMTLQSCYNDPMLYANSYVIGFNTEGTVSNITYSNATDNSILLSFNNYASTPNSYTLNIIEPRKIIPNIADQYTINDLSSNTVYNTTIQSMYDNSWNIIF